MKETIIRYKKLIKENYKNYDLYNFNIKNIYKKLNEIRFLNVNLRKIDIDSLKKRLYKDYGFKVHKVNKHLLVSDSKGNLVNTTPYMLGYFYIQDIISDLISSIVSRSVKKRVLDMCAAPGGKTFAVWKRNPLSKLIAVDSNSLRYRKMIFNFERLGMLNIDTFFGDARYMNYDNLDDSIDTILIDAPCSGNFSLDENWFEKYNLKDLKSNSRLQFQLLTKAIDILKRGGHIIYSTCTMEPEENELVIQITLKWAEEYGIRIEVIDIKEDVLEYIKNTSFPLHYSFGLTNIFGKAINKDISKAIRFWPFICVQRPYFIIKLRKF